MAYMAGLTGPEINAPQYVGCDLFMGALPLAEPFCAMSASDPRMVDTLDVIEEIGTSESAVLELAEARRQKGLDPDESWFWLGFAELPKASHNANLYLLQDDVPNFLRFFLNTSVAMVGANGKLWEHWHQTDFDGCNSPDNGTAGWFLENFRNLLVMEDGDTLWLARATPRSWLAQGGRITVANAPTYFGMIGYEIRSDVDHGKISVSFQIQERKMPARINLRLRHPNAAPIRRVIVNGIPRTDLCVSDETITLTGLAVTVDVVAEY
jgi:hypothetical protein